MTINERILASTSYFLAFWWGIGILLSFIGWGGILDRILFPKDRVDWSQKAAWGMAFSICVGGLLNLTWTISRTTILIYLGIGFFYCLVDFYKIRDQFINKLYQIGKYRNKLFILGIIIVFSLILLDYASWVYTSLFNWHDDYHAYFVFPNKMLQIGSMGPDPFSDRRLEASLGGQSFLHTFILSALNEANLNIIDPGIALIINVGLILAYLQKRKVAKEIGIFLILLLLFLPHPKVNITSTVTITTLLLSLFITLDWDKLKSDRYLPNAVIVALITAAICALKSSSIPTCAIFLSLSYSFYLLSSKNDRRAVIHEFFLSIILIFIFLLPWMISMYQSSGTFLYPILGKGYHGSVYSHVNYHYNNKLTISQVLKILSKLFLSGYFILLIGLGIVNFTAKNWQIQGREALLSLWIGVVLGTIIIVLTVGTGPGIERYPIPLVNAITILLTINIFAIQNNRKKESLHKVNSSLIAIFLAGVLMSQLFQYGEFLDKNFYTMLVDIKKGLSHTSLFSDREIYNYQTMQASIPEGETVLTRLDRPFLLNFKRNTIWIADWPGGASPPPGMPLFKGSEVLANYLISQSIVYVAYSYANEANFSEKEFKNRLNSGVRPWQRITAKQTFDFQDNVKKLGETRKIIYDDGKIFVLDLSKKIFKLPKRSNN